MTSISHWVELEQSIKFNACISKYACMGMQWAIQITFQNVTEKIQRWPNKETQKSSFSHIIPSFSILMVENARSCNFPNPHNVPAIHWLKI